MSDKPIAYQLDHDRFYAGPADIDPDPEQEGEWLIPGDCVDVEPPPPLEGKLRRWVNGTWEYVDLPPSPPNAPPAVDEAAMVERIRAAALGEQERRLSSYLASGFTAQPAGMPMQRYATSAADNMLLMMAAQQSMGAAEDWTTPIAAQGPDDADPVDIPHTAAQVQAVVAAWQAFVSKARSGNAKTVSDLKAAATLDDINTAMARAFVE